MQEATGPGHVTGQLPQARSDLSAVTVGSRAYLAGGYDGVSYNPEVLATTDGHHFRVAARLPVPVRYAAVASAGNQLWVFGGRDPSRAEQPHPAGQPGHRPRRIAGHLPVRLAGATGIRPERPNLRRGRPDHEVGERKRISGTVYSYTPGQPGVRPAGTLPEPVAYAAAAVQDGTAYLIGGDNGAHALSSVTQLRLVPASSTTAASLGPGGAPWLGPPLTRRPPGPAFRPLGAARRRADRRRLEQPAAHRGPAGPDPLGVPAARRSRPGQAFRLPDDAFFSPDGKDIVATEEDYSVDQRDQHRPAQDHLPVRHAGGARAARPTTCPTPTTR